MSLFSASSHRNPNALLLSAHTDDCEIGMGATISRLVLAGYNVRWITFCNAWQSLPEGFDKNTLIEEQKGAATSLGVPEENVRVMNIPVRRFPEFRQTILDELIKESKAFPPELVFCPSQQDIHQDHLTLAQEAERAFKGKTILGYILPWNTTRPIVNCHVEVSENDCLEKEAALKCYKSQASRQYFQSDAVRAMLRFNGLAAGFDLAESFEVIRLKQPL